eukprot:TRINITY_DN6463_c0_g1_i3.p1 TRINITY_DN6463_c0_g1~~TRINITY_DN6463_c0_g1_i3.p1  ORF type:complete len:408 (-),score=68.77 TRINITY_DN6463_c0_g1_i3:40-1263(-)
MSEGSEDNNNSYQEESFATKAVKRYEIKYPVPAVSVPIFTSSTYALPSAEHAAVLANDKLVDEGDSSWFYSRWANPTVNVAERIISNLEGAHGTHLTSSGMSAITTVLLAFLKQGDHMVCPKVVYGGTHEFVTDFLPNFGVTITTIEPTIENYRNAIQPNTKILYGETPSNPLLRLLDLPNFGQLGKEKKVITVVDSTMAGPYLSTPILHGIDIVIHSATKYLNGHCDVIAGSISSGSAELHSALYKSLKILGGVCAPQVAYLIQRGIKTLDMRMERHCSNAFAIAKYLEAHPKVQKVYYPGLPSHPQHDLARRLLKNGFGGMVTFEVKGGLLAGKKLVENVKLITLAVSLGGVESLIEHPASMTHTMVPRQLREEAGITDGLIRLSVGVEGINDLINDLDHAFSKI